MNCREFVSCMDALLAEELDPNRRAEAEAHLQSCADCGRYFDAYCRTVELGRSAFSEARGLTPDAAPEDLVQSILATRGRKD